MNEDDRDEFLNQLAASYGQIEGVLGTDGYAEFLRAKQAEHDYLLARASLIRSWSSFVSAMAIIGMLVAMPVIVFLWRWAI